MATSSRGIEKALSDFLELFRIYGWHGKKGKTIADQLGPTQKRFANRRQTLTIGRDEQLIKIFSVQNASAHQARGYESTTGARPNARHSAETLEWTIWRPNMTTWNSTAPWGTPSHDPRFNLSIFIRARSPSFWMARNCFHIQKGLRNLFLPLGTGSLGGGVDAGA
jgi:hypothetical protein